MSPLKQLDDQITDDTRGTNVVERKQHSSLGSADTHSANAAVPTLSPAIREPLGQAVVAGETDHPTEAKSATFPRTSSPWSGSDLPEAIAFATPNRTPPRGPFLADPFLALHAEIVSDLEKQRIANENRLRIFTTLDPDEDGIVRGFGLDESHPDVAKVAALVDALKGLEHQAVLNLQRAMRKHPLGPWLKAAKGVGEKQGARLLASVGDPYWNTLHDRPRTVSELWAYCGLHVLPAGHTGNATQNAGADGDQTGSDPSHPTAEARRASAGVAARRRKGVKSNWNADAKMRAYLVAVSCMKTTGPYREVYLDRRAHTLATHPDWTPGHSHNDGLRITAKAVLKDLWIESRRLHQEPS